MWTTPDQLWENIDYAHPIFARAPFRNKYTERISANDLDLRNMEEREGKTTATGEPASRHPRVSTLPTHTHRQHREELHAVCAATDTTAGGEHTVRMPAPSAHTDTSPNLIVVAIRIE